MATFHVGINPSILFGLLYNDSNGEITEFVLKLDSEKKDHGNGLAGFTSAIGMTLPQPYAKFVGFDCIKEIYENIKTKIGDGKLGCACIVMEKYDNSSKKCFIKMGLEAGFERVEIIDPQTALYLHATFYSKYVPNDDDFIGIIINDSCYLWKKINKKSAYIECVVGNFEDEKSVENFLSTWKFEKCPNIFLCNKSNKSLTKALAAKYKFSIYRFEDFIYPLQF